MNIHLIISSTIFILITILIIVFHKEKYTLLKKMINNTFFKVGLFVIFCFSFYTLRLDNQVEENHKLQKSVKQGLLGLIIAFMSYLDLLIAPFWAIFLTSYYLDI